MRFPPRARIHTSAEFAAIFAKGKSVAEKALALYWLPGSTGTPRVGFCVGKRMGKAVRRNRIKRLLKESWRGLAANAKTPADLVFVARFGGVQFSLDEWSTTMHRLLCRAGIVSASESDKE